METHGYGQLDKRLSRIERWLRRCAAACRCGSWNSALMEVECMEAEAKGFREELWSIACDEAEGRVRRPIRARIFTALRVSALASVLVLSAGLPLATEQDAPRTGFGFTGNSVAVLTSTEGDILDALRESLSNRNAARVVLTISREEDDSLPAQPAGAAAAAVRPARPSVAAPAKADSPASEQITTKNSESRQEPAGRASAREPSVEEVISLIQVGQRALRISEPAVRILP